MLRLFLAVNFSDEVKARLLEIQDRLRTQCLRGNFSRPENLHLTLAFIGETPEEKLESIFRIIDDIKTPSFDVPFNRTGCFSRTRAVFRQDRGSPPPGRKELWWIGAEPDSPGLKLLKTLHERLLHRFLDAGFSVDVRPFNAHITLGREIKRLEPVVLDCPELTVRVDRVSLMKSEHISGVLTYTELSARTL